jgi:hypothetical protein
MVVVVVVVDGRETRLALQSWSVECRRKGLGFAERGNLQSRPLRMNRIKKVPKEHSIAVLALGPGPGALYDLM